MFLCSRLGNRQAQGHRQRSNHCVLVVVLFDPHQDPSAEGKGRWHDHVRDVKIFGKSPEEISHETRRHSIAPSFPQKRLVALLRFLGLENPWHWHQLFAAHRRKEMWLRAKLWGGLRLTLGEQLLNKHFKDLEASNRVVPNKTAWATRFQT